MGSSWNFSCAAMAIQPLRAMRHSTRIFSFSCIQYLIVIATVDIAVYFSCVLVRVGCMQVSIVHVKIFARALWC